MSIIIAASHWNPMTPFKDVETEVYAKWISITGLLRVIEAVLCWITYSFSVLLIVTSTCKYSSDLKGGMSSKLKARSTSF